jgi:hypothetical protein
MSDLSLQVQVKSLETQISVLKAQLALSGESAKAKRGFADLYGILAGKSDSTEEEISSAEYDFQWDQETEEQD